jgi:hypothetical protein
MLKRNITKFYESVILLTVFCLIFSACQLISTGGGKAIADDDKSKDYNPPKVVGTIESKEISESSGVIASRCNQNVLWTHNDSGDDAFIYALDTTGKKLGTWKIAGAKNHDWEDIATFKNQNGECFLYLGDTGNNNSKRDSFTIYKVKEPIVSAATDSSKKNPLTTDQSEAIKFSYPDSAHDAETLMVHPVTGDIYVLTKYLGSAAGVYKLAANYNPNDTNTLTKVGTVAVPAIPNGLLTGGDISPDGRHVIICDYFNGYELTLPADAKNFDEIWKQKPLTVELGDRNQGEAVGYAADGKSIFATSEKKNSPVIQVERKQN